MIIEKVEKADIQAVFKFQPLSSQFEIFSEFLKLIFKSIICKRQSTALPTKLLRKLKANPFIGLAMYATYYTKYLNFLHIYLLP